MKELPVFEAVIKDEDEGILAISLVENPAIESGWVMLSKEEVNFYEDEEKHWLTGPVIIPDKKIYRREGDKEYYIVFSKETIEELAKRLLASHCYEKVDEEHNGRYVKGVELIELYLKGPGKGEQFKVADGSLIATYKITDPGIWEKARNGEISGYSLCGLFSLEDTEEDEYADLLRMLSKVRRVK